MYNHKLCFKKISRQAKVFPSKKTDFHAQPPFFSYPYKQLTPLVYLSSYPKLYASAPLRSEKTLYLCKKISKESP